MCRFAPAHHENAMLRGAASIGRIRFGHRGNAEAGMAVETDRFLINAHDALCDCRPSHRILRLLAAQIPRDHLGMTTKSRQSIYGASVRYSAERASRRSHFVALRPTKISANDSPTTRHGNLIAASRRLRPMLERAGSCASADNGNALVRQFAARRGLCNFPVCCLLLKLLSPAPLGPIHDMARKICVTHFISSLFRAP